MTGFPEWSEVAKDPLILPINGVRYEIPPLGYLDAIKVREAQERTRKAVDGEDIAAADIQPFSDEDFYRMMLGSALLLMRENNVPQVAIVHAAAVAHTDATLGRQQALYVWERGLDPEALAADMAAIREALTQDEKTKPARKRAARKTTRSTTSPSTA
jgi:hypothetical protein